MLRYTLKKKWLKRNKNESEWLVQDIASKSWTQSFISPLLTPGFVFNIFMFYIIYVCVYIYICPREKHLLWGLRIFLSGLGDLQCMIYQASCTRCHLCIQLHWSRKWIRSWICVLPRTACQEKSLMWQIIFPAVNIVFLSCFPSFSSAEHPFVQWYLREYLHFNVTIVHLFGWGLKLPDCSQERRQ